jgi:hypothetical protein
MFAATLNDFQDTQHIETRYQGETPEQEHARLVREWTETLSNLPGTRGRMIRMALTNGWC